MRISLHFLYITNKGGEMMLTKNIAEDIVKETSLRLQRNVNIMNTEGVIIATQEKSRIGTIHEGAISVLQSGKSLIINTDKTKDWKGAQPGLNLPIVYEEEIVGVVGVTGDPAKIENVGELVKMTAELMVKQASIFSKVEWRQRTKAIIMEQLLQKDPPFSSIDRNLHLLGLNPSPPFMTILVNIIEYNVTYQILNQQLESSIGKNHMLITFMNTNHLVIVLYNLNEKDFPQAVTHIYQSLKELSIIFRMVNSLPFYDLGNFRQSYIDCEMTLEISDPNEELVSFTKIEARALIYQLDNRISKRFSQRVLNNLDDVKVRTLENFFSNDLNIQKTAEAMFVHRNTLIYRLHKIVEECGYDPRNFQDALIIQIALWIQQRK